MAAAGAHTILLTRRAHGFGRTFVRIGVMRDCGHRSCWLSRRAVTKQSMMVSRYQPVDAWPADGRPMFRTSDTAPLAIIGQPDTETGKSTTTDPEYAVHAAEFLTYAALGGAKSADWTRFPRDEWPDNIPLLYSAITLWWGTRHRAAAHCAGVGCRVVARTAFTGQADSVDSDAFFPLRILRHLRLDDGGNRTAALADLSGYAHREQGVSPLVSAA